MGGSVEAEENLRLQGREARVVFFPHAACAQCDAYVRTLAAGAPALRDWDACVAVVLPADSEQEQARARALAASAAGVTVLQAPAGVPIRERAEVPRDSAAILIADRYGDIWQAMDMGAGHAFPDVPELEAWLRFLATQCPE